MAELNDKLITYGNLSTFYNKLQEQGLGGNAIEEVSELPNASENKDKLFRLDNGDKDVYAAKLLSSETTTTNRLPDEQQIDKAYLFEIEEDIYYYKGAYKIVCSDGEIDGYLWGEYIVSLKNAETITQDSGTIYYVPDGVFDNINKTITFDTDLASYKSENEDTDGFTSVGVTLVYAIYNAPEANQIGNATMTSTNQTVRWYEDTEWTIVCSDGSKTMYCWTDNASSHDYWTEKKASEIVSSIINGSVYLDIPILDMDWEDGWTSNPTTHTITNLNKTFDEVLVSSLNLLDSLYIPQLNAPDSEQVGNAYLHDDGNHTFYYQGVVEGHFTDGVLPVYRWGDEEQNGFYTKYPANQQYHRNDNEIEGCFEDSVELYWDSEQGGYYSSQYTISQAESIISNSTISDYLDAYSTVKYQRTVVTEVWDWEQVPTKDYVDDAIAEIPEYTAGTNISINDNNEISCTYSYSLPTASNSTLGGVKVGSGLEINGGVLSLNKILLDVVYDLLPLDKKYITIEATQDNTQVIYKCVGSSNGCAIKYSTDLLNWATSNPSSNNQETIATINIGEKVYIKGENNYYASGFNTNARYYQLLTDKDAYYYGNIMSLIYGENFIGQKSLPNQCRFDNIFSNPNLISNEQKHIILPATTIVANCYSHMFDGCIGLTVAPELPATTLASACYGYMFRGCSGLTVAPELPATTLTDYCYMSMFQGCTNLTSITMLATNASASDALNNWVTNVSSTGTFVKASEMTTLPTGNNGIPSGWTVQDYVAPTV